MRDFKLPNLGEGVDSGVVVTIFVQAGDKIEKEAPLIEVESNKAILVVPSPWDGQVIEVVVQKDQEIRVGQVVLRMEVGEAGESLPAPEETAPPKEEPSAGQDQPEPKTPAPAPAPAPVAKSPSPAAPSPQIFHSPEVAQIAAGPAARKLARELGVDLREVQGSKQGGRIDIQDVKDHIKYISKTQPSGKPASVSSGGTPSLALPDFAKFGATRREPLSLIRKIISERMTYSWSRIPHVHQFCEVDITDITAFHHKYSDDFKKKGSTTSITAFLIKGLGHCLKEYPVFNTSLDEEKKELIYKEYYHVGVAVDTPAGLIVPVIKDVDQKSIFEIGRELRDLAGRARDRKILPEELSGACITISNLGGIGGSFFTPIINPPEVAILGVGRNEIKPLYKEGTWIPRTVVPLCMGYDHRVIDGADGTRFIMKLSEILENFERFLLGG